MATIGLTEAIEQLREELGAAQQAGANQQLRFEVSDVEIEFLVELRKEVGAKVSFAVLLGADGKIASGTTHRLTLRLAVRDEALGGRNAMVANDRERGWESDGSTKAG